MRSDWNATQPPADGWVPVTLPDVWTHRWPTFDGVVWYRLTWHESAANATAGRGLMLEYLNMAGAVYLNGSLLGRDDSLVEPLTRAWNTPRFWVVSAPTLRAGENTLLIRVSGLSAYSPGLGPLVRGTPDAVHDRFEAARWVRRDMQLFSLAITVTLGGFVLMLWLHRRKETAYGWFSAMSLAWWCYAVNQVVTSPWPFTSTHAWEVGTSIAFLVYCACFTMFVLRFCRVHMRWLEIGLWTVFAVGAAWLLVTPERSLEQVRALWALIPGVTFLASCVALLILTWRSRRWDLRVVSLCAVTFIVAGVHDFLVFFGVLSSNVYYTAQTSQVLLVCMAVVLARRFADNLRRIEQFNDELTTNVTQARAELAQTMTRQHELEVTNARLAERLTLAHDLHDGLGGTLVSSIAAIEHAPDTLPPDRFLGLLKELRDDLRIVIDTAASHERGASTLAEQIAPLRHRITTLFESQEIACEWRVSGVETCGLSAAHTLDVMRILQEALTNVLKHSGARRVQIDLHAHERGLALRVTDDGVGFDTAEHVHHLGAGLRSMRNRAQRLGGTLHIAREHDTTVLSVEI